MPRMREGFYRIGCRAIAITADRDSSDKTYEAKITSSEGSFACSTLPNGYREHWLVLADLALRLAEHSESLDPESGLTRDIIRRCRLWVRPRAKEAKRIIRNIQMAEVGWRKE